MSTPLQRPDSVNSEEPIASSGTLLALLNAVRPEACGTAAAYQQLGQQAKAEKIMLEYGSTNPHFPAASWLRHWLEHTDLLHQTLSILYKLGIPAQAEPVT